MVKSNGQAEFQGLAEESQRLALEANQQIVDALVTVGKAYQQLGESTVRLSFAQWKSLNNFVAKQVEQGA